MSTCISRAGEYSDHELTNADDPFACQRCFAFAEAAAVERIKALEAKLALPCGSCHPCTEWANQTWVNAGERLPHVHEWQEMKARLAAVKALACEWEKHTDDPRAYAAARIFDALETPSTPPAAQDPS